jgi:hypothetical protein
MTPASQIGRCLQLDVVRRRQGDQRRQDDEAGNGEKPYGESAGGVLD